MSEVATDALTAADNYRRACELRERARAELVAAVSRDRAQLNLKALSQRAGLWEKTLYNWIREVEVGNGGQSSTAG